MRNLKRVLSLVMAVAMLIGLMVVSASAASTYEDFTDKDEIVNTEAVNTLVSLGVLNGKEDGSYFDPTGIVTRAEMAKIIAVCLNGGKDPLLGSGAVTTAFSDVPSNHWASAYIAYCANLGIINGKGDGTFGPEEQVTGTAAAKMFLCAIGYRSDIEGLTGTGWDLNTDTLANKVGLYEDMSIVPSNGLSRDNTAQLVYNGIQANEVEYENNYGEYSGVIYAQPIGTVLENRFHVRKVTGILEANDKVSVAGYINMNGVAGHTFGSVALENESLLYVTNVAGYNREDYGTLYGPATYKIDTSDEMVGQEIVIYVKYLNDLSPNAAYSTVVGDPILTDNNTVVETNARLRNDAAVRSALRAGGMTNIGTPNAVLYTEANVQAGVASGITDTIARNLRGTDVNNDGTADNTRSAGIFQRFIDNDGNGYPDYIVQIVPVLSAVNSVNTDKTKYTFTGIANTIDSDDIVTDEDLARNDVILINKFADDCYYISYPETVEGAIESYNTNNDTVSVDGTSYANSGGKNLAVSTGQDQILTEEMVDGTYIFYLDPYGNVLGMLETEGVVGNYAVVQGWNRTGNATMGYSVTVKLLMQDGTTANYDLNLASTAVRLGKAASNASTQDKEDAITVNDKTFFGEPSKYGTDTDGMNVVDHLFSYTLDGNTVTLSYPQEVNDARYMSTYVNDTTNTLITTDNLVTTPVDKNSATYNLGNGRQVVANDKTLFFIKDVDGDYYVVTGLANLPSNTYEADGVTKVPGIPVNATNSDTISYQAPGSSTWVARAVFLETTKDFQSVRDFVFVTDKYVTKNVSGTSVYSFTVVNTAGEESTMTTTQNANNLKNTVREWYNDGSYIAFENGDGGAFTWHNVYVSKIDGNVITLNDIDTDAVRGSYRVDGGADIWDVQTTPVEDALQVNDKVGVYLDSDHIVTAAFIYGVMNGAYAPAPVAGDITLNGIALNADANAAVTAAANTKVDVTVAVSAGVSIDSLTIGGTSVTNLTKNGNVYTGKWNVPAVGGVQQVVIKVSQSGMDSLTKTYTYGFNLTVSAAPDPDAPAELNGFSSVAEVNEALKSGSVTLTTNPGQAWAPAGRVDIPAGKTLTINGDYNGPAAGDNIQGDGKLVVTGTYKPGNDSLVGNIDVATLDMDATTNATISGKVSADNVANAKKLTVTASGSLTLGGDLELVDGSSIGGTLNVADGKKVTAAASSAITLNGTSINGDVDLSAATTANLTGNINVNSGSELTFDGYNPTSATVTVKSGATMNDKSGVACKAGLTEIFEAGATVQLSGTDYIVPSSSASGILALSTGKVTITTNHVVVNGTAKLNNNVVITVANDKFELAAGSSLDMNGKNVTASNADNQVVFGANVTITNYTGAQNFYDNAGSTALTVDQLAGKSFTWNTDKWEANA